MEINNKKIIETDPYFEEIKSKTNISFDFVLWFYRILKYWYLFIISIVLFLGYAYIKNKSWVPYFNIQAMMILEDRGTASVVAGAVPTGSLLRNTENQQIVLQSYGLTERTVKNLPANMRVDYFIQTRFKYISLYTDTPIRVEMIEIKPEAYNYTYEITYVDQTKCEISYKTNSEDEASKVSIIAPFGQEIDHGLFKIRLVKTPNFRTDLNSFKPDMPSFNFRFLSEGQLIGMYNGRIYSELKNDNSTVLVISMTGSDPARDSDYLKALLSEFESYNLTLKNEQAELTIDFLDSQLKHTKYHLSFHSIK